MSGYGNGYGRGGGGSMTGAEIVAALDGEDMSSIGDHIAAALAGNRIQHLITHVVIDANTDTIPSNSAIVVLAPEHASGPFTLSSTPSIANGSYDGQVLMICWDGPGAASNSDTTIQDEVNLPGSGLDNGGVDLSVNYTGSVVDIVVTTLRWNQSSGVWQTLDNIV